MSDKLNPETATWADVKARVSSGAMCHEKMIALLIAAIALENGGEVEVSNQSLREVLQGSAREKTGLVTTIHASGIEPAMVRAKWVTVEKEAKG